MRVKILPSEVAIGDRILIDPLPEGEQETPYHFFEDRVILVEEIIPLPDGGYYFIYGGDQRDSVYISKKHNIKISLKNILKKL